jgi:hypothetical protein
VEVTWEEEEEEEDEFCQNTTPRFEKLPDEVFCAIPDFLCVSHTTLLPAFNVCIYTCNE